MSDDECTCGRRRATAADLERWHAEVELPSSFQLRDRYCWPHVLAFGRDRAGMSTLDFDGADVEPLWARALCWTTPGRRCGMRRRWASDRHIREARMAMLSYAMRLAGATCGHLGDNGEITVGPLTPSSSTATN